MIRRDFNHGWIYHREGDRERVPVTLPHDAMLPDERSGDSPGGAACAFYRGGRYIYEKEFPVPEDWQGRRVYLEFGGVYRNSTVYVNDSAVGGRPYGYVPFTVELTSALRVGETNRIRVEADNTELPNSRWYSGGGIYRPVSLLLGEDRHIAWEGVKIRTLSVSPAQIRVQTAVVGCEDEEDMHISLEIRDREGTVVAAGEGDDLVLEIPEARLWSAESPALYQCRAALMQGDMVVDQALEVFGIRSVTWDEKGFCVNGESTLLRGACIHHDNGILGACSFPEAEERRVKILKGQGFNALRMAHNPASRVLLEACDRLGMYLIDETFDMWYEHKNPFDYASDFPEWHMADLEAMVRQDRNHPSVIMYSIGNEVSEPVTEEGMNTARAMIRRLHEMDDSRPVTAGINLMLLSMAARGKGLYREAGNTAPEGAESNARGKKASGKKPSGSLLFNTMVSIIGTGMNSSANGKGADRASSPILDALDIAGYNYASGRYHKEGKEHPGRLIYGSETFPQDIGKNWEMVKKYPWLIGDFMWTGWDYLGECALGSWNYQGVNMKNVTCPWMLAEAGAIDITGYPGAEAFYASSIWNCMEHPYIGVRPVNHPGVRETRGMWRGSNAFASWSWKGCEGSKAVVEVYAASDRARFVKLYCNGVPVGRRDFTRKKAVFHTTYEPGTLAAVTYDGDGNRLGGRMLATATGELHLSVKPEKKNAAAGEVVFVHICLHGSNNVVESNCDQEVMLSVEHGELLGFGSADPCPAYSYTGSVSRTCYGRALAAVRPDGTGDVLIHAYGDSLTGMGVIHIENSVYAV